MSKKKASPFMTAFRKHFVATVDSRIRVEAQDAFERALKLTIRELYDSGHIKLDAAAGLIHTRWPDIETSIRELYRANGRVNYEIDATRGELRWIAAGCTSPAEMLEKLQHAVERGML